MREKGKERIFYVKKQKNYINCHTFSDTYNIITFFNVKNMKIILSKFFITLITRVNEIEESLIAKGYSNE